MRVCVCVRVCVYDCVCGCMVVVGGKGKYIRVCMQYNSTGMYGSHFFLAIPASSIAQFKCLSLSSFPPVPPSPPLPPPLVSLTVDVDADGGQRREVGR